MKITPVLLVEAIEPCLPFWVDRMGFQKTAEVPHGDRLGFVILVYGDVELMFQTLASARDDAPQLVPAGQSASAVFIVVDDFADAARRLAGYPIALPERTTFYGMREIGVIEPGGHSVVFAAPV